MVGGLKFPLKEHKTLTEFKNNDFNADKPRQYERYFKEN